MSVTPKQIIDRLGDTGLSRVLDDLLDKAQLVHLANACGLKYPGMRTQSQERKRLLADLVAKAGTHALARQAVVRTLTKETAEQRRAWAGLDAAAKASRLADEVFLLEDSNLGLHLFLLAGATERADLDGFAGLLAHHHLLRVASNGRADPGARKVSREESRSKKRINELEKKVRHLEGQVVKTRDSQKTFKRDLIQRKGELAESRMLVERLRGELLASQAAARAGGSGAGGASAERTLSELSKAVHKLAAEQKKLAHRLDKAKGAPAPAVGPAAAGTLANDLKQLRAEWAALRERQQKTTTLQVKQLDDLIAEVRSLRGATPARKARPARAKGPAQRVGVYIDVQNVYYGARKLKGKLDFDALLEAAVLDRRLIRATAYVVESKEIDQSQFIAMLHKRGIEVQRKPLRVRADGSMKGDWDMELALDILEAAGRLDVVVLVSGDGDFTSLVKRVKGMGPRVEVIAFPRMTAKALIEAADRFQPLDRKFMIYTKKLTKPEPPKPPKRPAKNATTKADAETKTDSPKPDPRPARVG